MLAKRMLDSNQQPVAAGAMPRWLEKTPKNALRIPFFDRLYGDALFILLWRDPRENLSSIIEAWKARRWVTYRELDGWDGPGRCCCPGLGATSGRPLPEIAAAQWEITNRTALKDLRSLPAQRWMTLRYSDLVANPRHAVQQIRRFSGIEFDSALERRVAGSLPVSRHTQTPPAPDKWRRNEQPSSACSRASRRRGGAGEARRRGWRRSRSGRPKAPLCALWPSVRHRERDQ